MEMAQQQAPPAALAPIAVVVDEVQINSDAMLVLAPGAQHVRDHTSFLNWATVYNGASKNRFVAQIACDLLKAQELV